MASLDKLKAYFRKTNEKHGLYNLYYCLKCEEFNLTNGTPVTKIIGRKSSFIAHLKHCPYQVATVSLVNTEDGLSNIDTSFSNDTQDSGLTSTDSSIVSWSISNSSWKKRRVKIQDLTITQANQAFSPAQTDRFQELTAEFIADCGLPFSIVEKKSFHRLLEYTRKTSKDALPNRKQVSIIMKDLAEKCKTPILAFFADHAASDRIQTVTMDGFEARNKVHIVGVILHSGQHWLTYLDDDSNVNECDRHNGIIVAAKMESLLIRICKQYPHLKFRAVCTDDAGQYTRARRILSLRLPH
jgi:hypothetical protein